jgi:cystathionine beta-lyase/cystathionine gamma-synthase
MNLSEILFHSEEDRRNYFHAVVPPIIQSSNFEFENLSDFKNKLIQESSHHLYTRGNNPTVNMLRKKIAALEKCEDSLIFSSGAAAISASILSNIQSGDHIVSVSKPYSWTGKFMKNFLSRFHIAVDFVEGSIPENFEKAIRPNTRLIFLESPNSLSFEIQDLRKLAQICKDHKLISVIDNSYCSPLYQNPAVFGIDIVVHSVTKYISGHSDVVLGSVSGSHDMIENIFNNEFMTLGMNASPFDCWLAIRGLRTLELRLKRSNDTAVFFIKKLKKDPRIKRIYYPFDSDFPQYDLALQQMSGCGGLFSIELNTDDDKIIEDFIHHLDKFIFAVSWGGYESLKLPTLAFYDIPGMPTPDLPKSFIRLYSGLENKKYLWENISKSLDKAFL